MKQEVFLNFVATVLIALSIILHLICVATPYYIEASLTQVEKSQNITKFVKNESSINSTPTDMLAEEGTETEDPDLGQRRGTLNCGMWELCLSTSQAQGSDYIECDSWGTDTSLDSSIGKIKSLFAAGWISVVRALAVIGVLLAVGAAVMAVINFDSKSKSKGDRYHRLHIFICAACVTAGVFMLLGDVIVAMYYKTTSKALVPFNKTLSSSDSYMVVDGFIINQILLSWGFSLDIVAVALAFLSGIAHLIGGCVAFREKGFYTAVSAVSE